MSRHSNGAKPTPGDNDGIPDMTGKSWEEVQAWAARNGYTLRQVASVNVDKPSPVPFRVSLTLLGPGQDATVVADEPGQKSKLVSGGTTYTVASPGQPPAPQQAMPAPRQRKQGQIDPGHPEQRALTVKQAAARLGMHKSKLYTKLTGEDFHPERIDGLRSFKDGNQRLILPQDVDD